MVPGEHSCRLNDLISTEVLIFCSTDLCTISHTLFEMGKPCLRRLIGDSTDVNEFSPRISIWS